MKLDNKSEDIILRTISDLKMLLLRFEALGKKDLSEQIQAQINMLADRYKEALISK